MNTFWGSLCHLFISGNKIQMIWCGAILLTMLILAVLHCKFKNDAKKIRIWRLLCLIPLLIAFAHFMIYVLGFPLLLGEYISLYLLAVFALIPIPFARRKIGYRISAALSGVLAVSLGFYFCSLAPNYHNYVYRSYTDSFHMLIQTMDREYVLKEWKEVDFGALEDKYMPLVEEAERERNPAKFAEAVTQFCNEMHDGHVFVSANYDRETYISANRPREYGLAMVLLDSGEVVAVCTTEEVNRLGIADGTVITKWNGKPVLQAAKEDVRDMGLPVKTNDERLVVIHLSAVGGETVEVVFLDEKGNEKTVTLSELGKVHTLPEAIRNFSAAKDLTIQENIDAFYRDNFSAKMLDEKCGYLVLNMEQTDSDLHDILGYLNGDHKWAREMFREKLRELRSQGMEYLVIDLRNNMGGFDEIGCALCDLLTTEDWYGQGLGARKNGRYVCLSDHGIHGDGEFADLQVVALTNYECASAGDGTALYLSRLSNVTLAGITDPCGCNQETGGLCVLSDGAVIVGYPTGLILNEDCEPNVDTRADRISRNPVEVRIPFDRDAALRIFRDKEDYELEWAIEYLKKQAE